MITQTLSKISPNLVDFNSSQTTFANEICVSLLQQLTSPQQYSEADLLFKHQLLNGILKLFMEAGVELYRNADKFDYTYIHAQLYKDQVELLLTKVGGGTVGGFII